MLIFACVIGIAAAVFYWRLAWFVVQAAAVPLLMACAWCVGALSGLRSRWRIKSRREQ
jgi:hypothetical protein